MRASIVGGLVAMAAMLVGCGAPVEQEDALTSQEAPIPDCSSSPDTLVVYYQDASLSLVIGERGCSCGSWVSWGRTSTYRENAYYC